MSARFRFFIDESILAVGKALAAVRDDVVHPGHPLLPSVRCGTLDPVWLPIVGANGLDLVVLTRDRHIRTKPAEKILLANEGARIICLTGKKDMSKWGKLELIVSSWSSIQQAADTAGPGPWFKSLTKAGLRDIPIK